MLELSFNLHDFDDLIRIFYATFSVFIYRNSFSKIPILKVSLTLKSMPSILYAFCILKLFILYIDIEIGGVF